MGRSRTADRPRGLTARGLRARLGTADNDVVVIGAGPAGLQIAACPQQHGRDVVVLEPGLVLAS